MMRYFWYGVLGLVLSFAEAAFAAQETHSATDPAQVQQFQVIKEQAEAGDAKLQFRLGLLYSLGRGVVANPYEAARWYKSAAEAGVAEAQEQFGLFLIRGEGVNKDIVEGQRWLDKAAASGRASANYFAAMTYMGMPGATQDLPKALTMLTTAAEQKYEAAITLLGRSLMQGKFGAPDYVQAKQWLERTAGRDSDAAGLLAELFETGKGVSPDLAKAQSLYIRSGLMGWNELFRVSVMQASHAHLPRLPHDVLTLSPLLSETDDSRLAAALQQQADAGDAQAKLTQAVLLLAGLRGNAPNDAKALALLRQAAELDNLDAKYLLARCLNTGSYGATQDMVQARSQLEALLEHKHPLTAVYVGQVLRTETWGSKNPGKAIETFSPAAEMGSLQANALLAFMYHDGEGTAKNTERSFSYRLRAAELGDSRAQLVVAVDYLFGLGVKADEARGYAWYQISNQTIHQPEFQANFDKELNSRDTIRAQNLLESWRQYGLGKSEVPKEKKKRS